MLQTIVEELERCYGSKKAPSIQLATVRRWMRATHPEVRGATYSFLTQPRCIARTAPPISLGEAFDWLLKYYKWCLTKDPQGEWPLRRATATQDLMVSFIGLWDDGVDVSYFERMKNLLADLYRRGSDELKYDLVYGTLEHLFERREIRKFFESWKDDPQLAVAYEDAMEWVRHGGKSPYTVRRRR
jgi:hypothetical protein